MRIGPIRRGVGDLTWVRVDLCRPCGPVVTTFSVLDDGLRIEVDFELDSFLLEQ